MILNLIQHVATQDQLDAGVSEPSAVDKAKIQRLLTFDVLPTSAEVDYRAWTLMNIANNQGEGPTVDAVMLGGAPFLMAELHTWALEAGIKPLYAFSVRESVESTEPDGSVIKRNVFRHLGFVEPE